MGLRSNCKDIAKDLLYYTGISRFLLRCLCSRGYPKLLIFTYHRVSPSLNGNKYMAVPKEIFDQHVRFIKDNFKTISMKDGLKALYENNSNEIYATINLDDGYLDNYLYALPVLKKYGVPATIFLTTDYIGKEHIFWWDRVFNIVSSCRTSNKKAHEVEHVVHYINSVLRNKDEERVRYIIEGLEKKVQLIQKIKPSPMLGWKEIKEMNGGLISFGSHTKSHRNLCLLKDDEVKEELMDSKKEIERKLGIEVSEFSYPFGIFDERVKDLVRAAGFKSARTTLKGFNYKESDRFLLNNIAVGFLLKKSELHARILSNALRKS